MNVFSAWFADHNQRAVLKAQRQLETYRSVKGRSFKCGPWEWKVK